MITIGDRQLRVTTDLDIEVDGRAARLVAAEGGDVMRLHTDDPGAFAHAITLTARSVPGPARSARSSLVEVAAQLDELGLRLEIVGRHGSVMELGHGAGSGRARRLLAGPHVRVGSVRAVLDALTGYVRGRINTMTSHRRRPVSTRSVA